MLEELLITPHANYKITPDMHIWSWEVPVYLFSGGLTAGIIVFASIVILMRREKDFSFAANVLPIWALVIISLGMGALFLDLEHKLFVWAFFLTLQPASPMSWGAWCLLIVYPVGLLLALATLRAGYPAIAAFADRFAWGRIALDWVSANRRITAWVGVGIGCFLALYTGVLLSAYSARPFWNSGVLAPLFLASGLSGAAALIALGGRTEHERHAFTQVDLGLLIVEAALIALFVVSLLSGSRAQIAAAGLILGGAFTAPFWLSFFLPGVLAPILIELMELTGRRRAWMAIAPVLVLFGGYMLRDQMTMLGQQSRFHAYEQAYDPALLRLLTPDGARSH